MPKVFIFYGNLVNQVSAHEILLDFGELEMVDIGGGMIGCFKNPRLSMLKCKIESISSVDLKCRKTRAKLMKEIRAAMGYKI